MKKYEAPELFITSINYPSDVLTASSVIDFDNDIVDVDWIFD